MTAALRVGDTVELIPTKATVTYDYKDGDYEVTAEGSKHVCVVPRNKLSLVKRQTPPEPAVDTVISYRQVNGSFVDYYREGELWRRVSPVVWSTSGVAWEGFDHSRVYLKNRSANALS